MILKYLKCLHELCGHIDKQAEPQHQHASITSLSLPLPHLSPSSVAQFANLCCRHDISC